MSIRFQMRVQKGPKKKYSTTFLYLNISASPKIMPYLGSMGSRGSSSEGSSSVGCRRMPFWYTFSSCALASCANIYVQICNFQQYPDQGLGKSSWTNAQPWIRIMWSEYESDPSGSEQIQKNKSKLKISRQISFFVGGFPLIWVKIRIRMVGKSRIRIQFHQINLNRHHWFSGIILFLKSKVTGSVVDPYHFDTDPDPRKLYGSYRSGSTTLDTSIRKLT